MENSTWKILAIVFIILFILETLFFIWIIKLGSDVIEEEAREEIKEDRCIYEICFGDYDYYTYKDGLCSCYVGNELKFSRFVTS